MAQSALPQTTAITKQKHPKPPKPPKTNKSDGNQQKWLGVPPEDPTKTQNTTKHKQPKQANTLANLMENKGNGRGCPKGPYHKPQKPSSKNIHNHQKHTKRANLMEIKRNGREVPPGTLPKTTKTIKQKQPKQLQTLANLMEIKGNRRGWPKVPYHKPQLPLSKNIQNHQHHKKRENLMDVARDGWGCPQRALPKHRKQLSKNNQNKQTH